MPLKQTLWIEENRSERSGVAPAEVLKQVPLVMITALQRVDLLE